MSIKKSLSMFVASLTVVLSCSALASNGPVLTVINDVNVGPTINKNLSLFMPYVVSGKIDGSNYTFSSSANVTAGDTIKWWAKMTNFSMISGTFRGTSIDGSGNGIILFADPNSNSCNLAENLQGVSKASITVTAKDSGYAYTYYLECAISS